MNNTQNTLVFLERNFVPIIIVCAIIGYVVLTLNGMMDLRQYILFLLTLVVIYWAMRNHGFLWLIVMGYIVYLLFSYFVPASAVMGIRDEIRSSVIQMGDRMENDLKEIRTDSAKR